MIGKNSRNFRLILISLLLPLLLVCLAGPALAEVVGKLSHVEGAVDVMPGGQLPAVAAKQGAQVQKGDFVRTKSNSRAEITFNDGSVVKIAQRSRIDVGEYSDSNRKLSLPRGKVQATVVPAAGGAPRSFEIRTPNAIAGVRGTSFFVYHQANVTGVAVVSGVVQTTSLSAPSRPVTLVAGTATTVSKKNAPTAPRPMTEKEINSHRGDVAPTTTQGQSAAPASGGEASSGSTGTATSTTSTTSTAAGSGTSTESGATGSGTDSAAGSGGSTSGGDTTTASSAPTASAPAPTSPAPAPTPAPAFLPPEPMPTPLPSPTIAPIASPTIVIPITDANEQAGNTIQTEIATSTDPGTTDPGTTDPGTTDPGTTTPGTTDPVATDPVATDPGTTDPGTTDPGTTTPPVFTSQLGGGLMSRDASIDPVSNLLTIVTPTSSTFAPVLSGTTSLWTGSALATLSGVYPALPLQHPNHYWQGKFFSNSNATHTTADGGAYFGYFGGMSLDDTTGLNSGVLDTTLSAIYIDPTGKAGIMQGSIPGTFSAGTISGTGTLTLTEMNAGSGLIASTFAADWWNPGTGTTVVGVTGPVITDTDAGSERSTSEGFLFDNALNQTGVLLDRGDVLQLSYLAADPSFGVWNRESFGSYDGNGTKAVLITGAEWGTVDANNIFSIDNYVSLISMGNWQAGALTGTADGVWGNLATGGIKILTGSLTGSVNPGTSTFGAASNGSFIDLNRFLSNPALATSLGFPTTARSESFALTGTGPNGSVNLGTVTFYSRNAADPLSLWVAPSISGSYTGSLLQQSFSLMNGASASTSSIMGDMRINGVSSANGTWLGGVNGMGETNGSFRSGFDGIAAGTFTGTTFTGSAVGFSHPMTYFSRITADLKRYNGTPTSYGTVEGVMGGMSLWQSTGLLPSEFDGIGFLTPSQALTDTDYVLTAQIQSFDMPTGLNTTADGGAYRGHIVAGVSTVGGNPGIEGIRGVTNALSIDPAGNIGVLHGDVFGFQNPFSKIWMVDGDVFPVTLVSNSGVSPTALATSVIDVGIPFGTGGTSFNGALGISFNGSTLGISGYAPDSFTRSFLSTYPDFGIGTFPLYATYTSPPATANAPWSVDFSISNGTFGTFNMLGAMFSYQWDPATGQLGAETRAAWHDMIPVDAAATPTTGIFIGETVGTFNPASLQAMTSGIWFETGKFLDLVANNPAALEKLKIPAFEVGRATFSGGTSDFGVTINDLTFFAPVNGGRPEIFASNNITGNYFVASPSGTATLSQTSATTVSGFTPTFTINQWDIANNKWSATLQSTGTGGVVGTHNNVQFMGTAAGRIDTTPGAFTGTTAGVVRVPSP